MALVVAWTALFYLQAVETVHSSARRVGFGPDEGAEGILVTAVEPGQPAARAGLRERDQVIAVGGVRMLKLADYDRAASRFRGRQAVPFRVWRGGAVLALSVVPGVPPNWFGFAVTGLTALGFLGIGLLALVQGGGELRTRLLLLFTVAVAFELALPANAIGAPWLGAAALSAYYLLTGLQIGLELHLASLIPERHAWLRRRPWVVGIFYALGLGLGIATCATFIAEATVSHASCPS